MLQQGTGKNNEMMEKDFAPLSVNQVRVTVTGNEPFGSDDQRNDVH